MPVYRVSGFAFRSAVDFPELDPAPRAVPRARFVLASGADGVPQWYHRWRGPDGRDWARFGRVADGYLVRFPRLADFRMSSRAVEVRCAPRPGVAAEVWRHLFLHQVLPLVLGQHGYLVLHASAVATRAGAVAFLGGAGRGKSTLAASFWAAGSPLVADDCLRVDLRGGRLLAVPSYPAVRLSPEALRRLRLRRLRARPSGLRKLLVASAEARRLFAETPLRLVRLYVLGRPLPSRSRVAVRIEPLSAREAMTMLVAHLYRLDLSGARRDVLARDFDRLAVAATHLSARRLRVRRGFEALREVREAIAEDLRQPSSSLDREAGRRGTRARRFRG